MIYLHIGTPKTGTTTIQKALVENLLTLWQNNFLFPKAGMKYWGHHNIYWELSADPKYDPKLGGIELLLEKLLEYKRGKPQGNIILSTEAFWTAFHPILERLVSRLSEIDEVSLVVYLREQASYHMSFWSMLANQKRTNLKYEKWSRNAIETNLKTGHYHQRICQLESLVTSPEHLIIRCYNKDNKQNHFNEFLSACNYNGALEELVQPERAHNADKFKGHFSIPKSIHELCLERYGAGNKLIAQKYFQREVLFT